MINGRILKRTNFNNVLNSETEVLIIYFLNSIIWYIYMDIVLDLLEIWGKLYI